MDEAKRRLAGDGGGERGLPYDGGRFRRPRPGSHSRGRHGRGRLLRIRSFIHRGAGPEAGVTGGERGLALRYGGEQDAFHLRPITMTFTATWAGGRYRDLRW